MVDLRKLNFELIVGKAKLLLNLYFRIFKVLGIGGFIDFWK